jgi:hypothetical protein
MDKLFDMKIVEIGYREVLPPNFTGIARLPSGSTYWYSEGYLHREDGPAIEYPYGGKWYLNGKEYTQEQHAFYVDLLKLKSII